MNSVETELTVLAAVADDPDLWESYGGELSGAFSFEPVKMLYSVLDKCWEKWHRLPTQRESRALIRAMAVDRKWAATYESSIGTAIDWVYSPRTEISSQMLEEFLKDSRIRSLKAKINEYNATTELQMWRKITEELEAINSLSVAGDDFGVFPFSDEVLESPIELLDEALGPPIYWNIKGIDDRVRGFRRKELVMFMGPTGAGKTLTLHKIALSMASQSDLFGVYFYNDNTLADTLSRMWTNQSGVPIDEDKENSSYSQILKVKNTIGMRLNTKELRPQVDGVDFIRSYVRRLQRKYEKKVDFIVVDYSDLLAPPANCKFAESRHIAKAIVDSLHALAKELDILIVTATQTNVKGLKDGVIDLTALSEAYAKSWVAAHVMSLNQNPAEKILGTLRIAVIKSRRTSKEYSVPMVANIPMMELTEDFSGAGVVSIYGSGMPA